MRLTLDTIRRAPQFTNALRQRELDLRGLGITVLEEHTLTFLNDSFDVLNLSQNPLARLEYFPGDSAPLATAAAQNGSAKPASRMMLRLQTLVVHRNRLTHVSEATCAAVLPNLRAFVADHNEFRELRDLLFLSHWKKLEILSIEHNPITISEDNARLRAYVVFLCPTLKLVNYQRVTQVDRQNVETMRKEFVGLVEGWRRLEAKQLLQQNSAPTEADASASESVKKIRKRSRHAREAASKNGSADTAPEPAASKVETFATPSVAAVAGEEEEASNALQARLEALEEKMAAAETEEELMELQQELTELETLMKHQQASKGTKKTRTS
ncbi:U2 small nuclear ribonucleoprotein 40K, putative [Trypanosoma brucei gambiense DAL972]|uniref:U2 small nuclear ribonucleoprotein 40K, putative n=2 Tax=Trypanosoma brucei TaxID=5691 RepID=D0A084_TRYB9|nr:U2 small nuclear ribonucleoprotein 40K, putative [Trypanosoma brucei gambiense DAL972]RHW68756.1 U2 small nuclear ribonucleoprotein 40K [Trypanosoma brucei equiperdum]CBH16642.1 U2 small nuclear ribonucleoprotein 40K, putative [Trypanosoma brucei gambiense DAL972]|eukprot:XP_011778906.1 U2 small nuclear ribonucleoprotein 40K, putative [Trypanosoma brucei gambiense DAL972]